jgi:hypothetical protein
VGAGRIQVLWEALHQRKRDEIIDPVPQQKLAMILSSIEASCPTTPEWQAQWAHFAAAEGFAALVCSALQLGLLFARWVLSTALSERASAAHSWPECVQCGQRLRSKGFRPRQMTTLIGVVR